MARTPPNSNSVSHDAPRAAELSLDEHIASLRTYVERHGEEAPPPRSFPVDALRRIAEEQLRLDDTMEPVLWGLAAIIDRLALDTRKGEDLLMRALVLPVFARLATPSERMARYALTQLEATSLAPAPEGDEPNKHGVALEAAQDALAFAAVESLARLGAAAPQDAVAALKQARTHRAKPVRSVASDVLRVVEDDYLPRPTA